MNPSMKTEETINELEFTTRANELFYDTVDHPNFHSEDQLLIYRTLLAKVKPVRFGDYLRRYIYRRAQWTGDFSDIPIKDYLDFLCDEFSKHNAPASFTPTKASLRNLAKNWLEQQTVNRNVVLLLGFGFAMSVEDVDDFLFKGLHEVQLNSKDPVEAICCYCYTHGYGYAKYEELWEQYIHQRRTMDALLDSTLHLQSMLRQIHTDRQLMEYLACLPLPNEAVRQSMAVRRQFDRLYTKACGIVASLMTQSAADTARINAARMEEALSYNAQLSNEQKLEMIRREKSRFHTVSPSEVGPGDLEQVLFAAIPRDKHGNMLPMKASALTHQFSGKRLTRQHITRALTGEEQITRYDLLTLHFFVFVHELDRYPSIHARYRAFVDSANQMLLRNGMGEYYVVNPYECFLLMCIIAQDPLGTFSDVWELSYQGTNDE